MGKKIENILNRKNSLHFTTSSKKEKKKKKVREEKNVSISGPNTPWDKFSPIPYAWCH